MGHIDAADTSVQRENGVTDDTIEKHLDDLTNEDSPYYNPDRPLSTIMHEQNKELIEYFRDEGIEFDLDENFPRAHVTTPDEGETLITFLKEKAADAGVNILLNTEATDLIMENDRVVGVKAKQEDADVEFQAKSVLLASGGFAQNQDMLAEYMPKFGELGSDSAEGATGDGIRMAKEVGADLVAMDNGLVAPAFKGGYGPLVISLTPAITVNSEGERFFSEDLMYDEVGQVMVDAEELDNYIIFDDKTLEMDDGEVYDVTFDRDLVTSADSPEELAEELDLPELPEAITRYNDMATAGEDADFQRELNLEPLSGKLYAVEVSPIISITYGGVRIDTESHVIDEAGDIVQGLYASGEVCGSVEYQEGLEYTTGVGQTIGFGRLAVETILKEIE